MIRIEINRFKEIYDGTIGELNLIEEGAGSVVFRCYTLEPAGEDTTEQGKDRRIPEGCYNVAWHNSPSQKRTCVLLFNERVPKSRYILIHPGNYPKDTSGCILVGDSYNNAGVLNSVKTYNTFFRLVQKYGIKCADIKNDAIKRR